MFSSLSELPLILSSPKQSRIITFINPVSFYGFKDLPCRNDYDYVFSDGALLTYLHNILFHREKIVRVSFDFSSIAHDVLTYAQRNKKLIVFIGGNKSEAESVEYIFKYKYKLIHCRCFSGFFSDEAELFSFVHLLNELKPDLIISGMGFPYQERFLSICKKNINHPFIGFTCGGFISQTALKQDYYAKWIKRFGLRWLQRAYLHKHVRERLLKDYPVFLIRYIFDALIHRGGVYK